MPSAPANDGSVSKARRDLDSALLVALGSTPGQAAGYLDRLYRSYGRWRAKVSSTEMKMRSNRKQMVQTGQTRDQHPAEVAGRRVWEELEHEFSLFPRDLLPESEALEIVNVPASPLFDEGLITTKTKRIDLGNFERVRFVSLLRRIGVTGRVEVPLSHIKAGAIADLFDEQEKRFLQLAAKNASKYVSSKEGVNEIVEAAVRHWHAASRRSALTERKINANNSLN
jgi:hypothetical protein